ncbi:Uncharacterized protein Rs2_23532 [Raphanus sativus]|nr:Uncharacterized protein Rs2_23532 [Raphanus sativus]
MVEVAVEKHVVMVITARAMVNATATVTRSTTVITGSAMVVIKQPVVVVLEKKYDHRYKMVPWWCHGMVEDEMIYVNIVETIIGRITQYGSGFDSRWPPCRLN